MKEYGKCVRICMREIQNERFRYDRKQREREKIERMRKNKQSATRTDGRDGSINNMELFVI